MSFSIVSTLDDTIGSLRSALLVSPDNSPLRRHLADTLVSAGRFGEAEVEYREGLRITPGDDELSIALAECFYYQGRVAEAMVLAEQLDQDEVPGGRPQLLLMKLHLVAGEEDEARTAYLRAIEADRSLASRDLESRLGLFEKPRESIAFDDVGGMEAIKEEIRMKAIHPIAHPELFQSYGKGVGGGVLLYGPPGCGKTYLARATAGEIEGTFISVGLSDVLDMWVGSSERNLHRVFEDARQNAPAVLFFDEVDALGAKRSDMRMSAGKHVINQFLAEFDGADASNDGVVIIGATNAPWNLDSAFRRPGRFDQVVFVPPPDTLARAAILAVQLEGKPLADIDLDRVAERADGFSGADLMGVVDRAVEARLRLAMRSGETEPITERDLIDQVERLRPSTDEWFVGAKNYVKFANDGGLYDELAAYLNGR